MHVNQRGLLAERLRRLREAAKLSLHKAGEKGWLKRARGQGRREIGADAGKTGSREAAEVVPEENE